MTSNPVDPGGPAPGQPAAGLDLERVWTQVAATVWQRRPGRAERLAARLLRSPGLARALLTTPSLVAPWLIATSVVLAAGAAATLGTGTPWVPLLAPALAAAGIACAYGPGIDPAYELSCTMAVSDRMVLIVRAVAVFAVNSAAGLAASAASATAAGITFGWLFPMAALSALALAVATVTRSALTGLGAGTAAWCVMVLSAQLATGQAGAAVSSGRLTIPSLACTFVCIAVVLRLTRTPRGTS